MHLALSTIIALGQTCAPGIDSDTLVKLVMMESGGNPYAVAANDGLVMPRQPQSYAQAVATVAKMQAKGLRFAAGLMQISSDNIRRQNLSWAQVFDPCTSMTVGQHILFNEYRRAYQHFGNDIAANHAAFSAYNTGSWSRGVTNGYVPSITPR